MVKRLLVALVLSSAIIIHCDGVSTNDLLDGRSLSEGLIIVPAVSELKVGESVTLIASGGKPPYSFSIKEGLGSVETSSGVFTATAAGTTLVKVEDSTSATTLAAISTSL